MFRVSTLDMANPPACARKADNAAGCADRFRRRLFGKETHLTVSGQLNVETYRCASARCTRSARHFAPRTKQHEPAPGRSSG